MNNNEKMNNNEEINIRENKKCTNKKIIIIIIVSLLVLFSFVITVLLLNNNSKKEKNDNEQKTILKELPLPEVSGGERGKLGIDKNINESNIDEYLNRSDSVYRDMRMLDDPATYENIGGDRFLSGYIKGFEVVPLPYLIPVEGLPEEVGKTYQGRTLFDIDEDGKYIPNYEESMKIIEQLFPKDKIIFLMCGGGGYAGMTKAFLVSLGWDETKIYNTGGYWYYDGKNNIEVQKVDGKLDFSNVPYHEIKFDELKEIKREIKLPVYIDDIYYNNQKGEGIEKYNLLNYEDRIRALNEDNPLWQEAKENQIKDAKKYADLINNMVENKKSFILNVFPTDVCYSDIGPTLSGNMYQFATDNNLFFYSMGLMVYRQTELYKQIKYAPTVIIVYKGKVLAFTDAESDEDLKYSQNQEEFNKWITKYIYAKK